MKLLYQLIIICFFGFSCSKNMLDEEFTNTPIGNFDAVWSEFNRNYAAFEAKKINWDSLYSVYSLGLNDYSSDQDLYNAVTGLIRHLNDSHIYLTASGFERFYSCANNVRPHFVGSTNIESGDDIRQFYKVISNKYVQVMSSGQFYMWGPIRDSKKNIGYLYIATFGEGWYPKDAVNQAMNYFENSDAIILDLRFNGGGATDPFLHLLSKFADKRRFYIQSKLRNGLDKKDFTEVYKHYFGPRGKAFTPKPVFLLVNKFSASASEHVFLAMKTLPYVTSVGDSTCGALSTVIDRIMPNGWRYRCCPQVLLDTLGNYLHDDKGRYPDGYGFVPNIRVINTMEELNANYDAILSKVIEIANQK